MFGFYVGCPRACYDLRSVRALFILLTIGLGVAAGYYGTRARSSYSAYSGDQLQQLEAGINELARPTEQQLYSRELLETEKRRRMIFPGLIAGAVLAAMGAYLSRGVRQSFAEEARLTASLGNPALVLEGARNKAAALLGVALTAPPEVIEAALTAQLASRDPARLAGIAPDLQKLVLDQREALIKARDLLIQR